MFTAAQKVITVKIVPQVDNSYWLYSTKIFEYYPDTQFKIYQDKDWQFPKHGIWQMFLDTLDNF